MVEEVDQTWAEFHKEIDRRLDAIRPNRVEVTERDWREPVYGWARNHIPDESHLVRIYAQREVDRREGQATKRGNRYLRDYQKGIIPLDWSWLGPLPIKVGTQRIRLDAATPDDIDDAARELAGDAKRVYDEVLILAEGLHDLARMARRAGLRRVAELGNQPLRNDGDPGGEEPPQGSLFDDDD